MIRKSMPSGHDPMGGNRFSEKIMLKQKESGMTIRRNIIPLYLFAAAFRASAMA
jgi:hypothetical protein